VLILRLVFNALARAKLAARGITTREVEEVVASGPPARGNPSARMHASIYVIGPTSAARFLTGVLQPDEADPTRKAPTGGQWLAPRDDIETILEVSVDPATLSGLSDRATREGRDIGDCRRRSPSRCRVAACRRPQGDL
jgi:hypothetical protein